MTMDSSTRAGRDRCQDLEPLLASYVDDEAGPQDRSAVDAHLTACPPCRDRVAGERIARAVVHARRDRLRACASDALRGRCAGLGGHAGARRSAASAVTRRWVPLSLAATLVLAVAGVFLAGLSDRVEVFAAQLALDHAKCFKLNSARIANVDPAALGREWADRHGWALRIPSGTPAHRLELLGVRHCGSTEGRVAHAMYRWRGEPLSVYVLPGSVASVGTVQNVVDSLGHEAVIWSASGRTYAVVGKGPAAAFADVAAYVRTTAQ